jgi:hypothetical protein
MSIDQVARSQLDCASLPSEGDMAGMPPDAAHPLAKAFNTEDSRLCGGCQGQNYEALRDAGLDIRQEDRPMMSELLSAVAGSDAASGAGLDPEKVDALFKAMDELGMLKDGKLTADELKTLLEYVKEPASAPEPLRALLQGAPQADAGMQGGAGGAAKQASGGASGATQAAAGGASEQGSAPSGESEAAAGGASEQGSTPSGESEATAGSAPEQGSAPSGASGATAGGAPEEGSAPNGETDMTAERTASGQSAGGSQATDGDGRRAARHSGESEAEKAGAQRRSDRAGANASEPAANEDTSSSSAAGSDQAAAQPGTAQAPTVKESEAAPPPVANSSQASPTPETEQAKSGAQTETERQPGAAAAGSAQAASPPQNPTMSAGTDAGTPRTPDVNQFSTIDPGQGPKMTVDENGKFVFNKVVDDSFLPEKVRGEMKQAVHDNMHLDFFKSTFSNEADAYQYMVHMANLESARGTTLENGADAQNTGGGSAGYMHLHTTYGLEKQSWGSPLNTEGWSKSDVLSDYNKYTTLVMRSLDNNFKQVGGTPTQDDVAGAMSLWWTGKDSAQAGNYYLSALSGGTGVNHNTGSIYA